MIVVQESPSVRSSRGGRPRDPSRDGVIRAAIMRLLADVGYSGLTTDAAAAEGGAGRADARRRRAAGGSSALTMDAVAAEAGVGKATIYRRWRTKQDLVADTITELNRCWTVDVDTGSLEGDLRQLVHRMVEMMTSPVGAATRSPLAAMQPGR